METREGAGLPWFWRVLQEKIACVLVSVGLLSEHKRACVWQAGRRCGYAAVALSFERPGQNTSLPHAGRVLRRGRRRALFPRPRRRKESALASCLVSKSSGCSRHSSHCCTVARHSNRARLLERYVLPQQRFSAQMAFASDATPLLQRRCSFRFDKSVTSWGGGC